MAQQTKSVYGDAGLRPSPRSFMSPKSTWNLQESFRGKAREQAHVPAIQSYHLPLPLYYTVKSNVKEEVLFIL